MALLKVNGVDIADPSSLQVDIMDLDGTSNRNAKGDLVRDRLAVKRKISLEWPALTPAQTSTILKAVQSVFFSCTYPDPMEGKDLTKTFYVGDRSAPLYKKGLWESLKMDFVEK
ncbi:DUF6711 family protein [Neobacillus mesonae]|uniref:DUF6711 family protein n=1 Tax=Neobacillus mesonae TaxID=1193713 RepID=UPI002E1DA90B|nr:hypothetical protein [Neobacillus mesonae]